MNLVALDLSVLSGVEKVYYVFGYNASEEFPIRMRTIDEQAAVPHSALVAVKKKDGWSLGRVGDGGTFNEICAGTYREISKRVAEELSSTPEEALRYSFQLRGDRSGGRSGGAVTQGRGQGRVQRRRRASQSSSRFERLYEAIDEIVERVRTLRVVVAELEDRHG